MLICSVCDPEGYMGGGKVRDLAVLQDRPLQALISRLSHNILGLADCNDLSL